MAEHQEDQKYFPIMRGHGNEQLMWERLHVPCRVPWSVVSRWEARAQRNHSQCLDRLAERGGLSPHELAALLLDVPLSYVRSATAEESAEVILSRTTPAADPREER